jgi:hypothetical protein
VKLSFAKLSLVAASSMALLAGAANAGITTYSGQDDGVGPGGPFPSSAAAQTAFLAAAAGYGGVTTETFESIATGSFSPVAIAGGAVITAAAPDFGCSYSEVCNSTYGVLYGFNTTPGGSNWYGFSTGSATITFAKPTYSFGLYLTGLQTVFTSPGDLTLTFSDGTAESLAPPINVNGGAEYFGFTDSTAISSVTISNLTDDAWGIDDLSYNFSAVPEPAGWALMLLGAGAVGGALRRKARTVTA